MTQVKKAPWTPEQVFRLTLRQMDIFKHKYKCKAGHELVPTRDGWVCEHGLCPHSQDWAFETDLDHSDPTLGFDPIERIRLTQSNNRLMESVKKSIRASNDRGYDALKIVLDRLSVYEPQITELLPWREKDKG